MDIMCCFLGMWRFCVSTSVHQQRMWLHIRHRECSAWRCRLRKRYFIFANANIWETASASTTAMGYGMAMAMMVMADLDASTRRLAILCLRARLWTQIFSMPILTRTGSFSIPSQFGKALNAECNGRIITHPKTCFDELMNNNVTHLVMVFSKFRSEPSSSSTSW